MAASTAKICTLDSIDLFLEAHKSLSHQHSSRASRSSSFTLLLKHLPLPPIPSDFPYCKLIPGTRFLVDAFKYAADFSVSYFLSHFHSDHYAGLNACWSKGIVYCSQTTARLLVVVLKVPSVFVVPLSVHERVLIDGCEVCLADANHCPGAVQFLFRVPGVEVKFERYVHTGDFRYNSSMQLDPVLSGFVGADAVFLDTTYCNPKFVFPSQEESIDYIVSAIQRAGVRNERVKKSVLFLVATYVIGKEKILIEIAKRCNRKVHVNGRKMAILQVLGYAESGVFTGDEAESDVHVVGWNVLGETWPYFRPNFLKMEEIMLERGYSNVVGFVPTGWTYEVKRNKFAVRSKDSFEIHLVPYSEHSNYEELREYVKFLKPKRVIPTVGLEVEKLDSKHVHKLQKHFAGLVDETANKYAFLMSLRRSVQETENNTDKDVAVVQEKGADMKKEIKSSEVDTEKAGLECVLDPSATDQDSDAKSSNFLYHEETEEIIKQLRICLPVWVTQNQMVALLKSSGGNMVDAVSNFYEHETEYREQVCDITPVASTSQTISLEDSSSLPKPNSVKSCPIGNNPHGQEHKFQINVVSVKTNTSPGKRAKTLGGKASKKLKSNSTLETSGSRQPTITRFFSKAVADVSQNDVPGDVSEQLNSENSILPSQPSKSFVKEIDQFIQIINGSESSRSYATSLIEKAKGDINLALDIYYSDREDGNDQKLLFSNIPTIQPQGSISLDNVQKSIDMASFFMQGPSAERDTFSFLSLPPEKYSPVEHACWAHGKPAPYVHLTRTFDLVEGEKGKNKANLLMCNMFRSLLALSPEDVLPAVYLCTNKIAADHENLELNIGGSLVTAALEEACGMKGSKIRDMYYSLGDLGDVAQVCRQTQTLLACHPPLLIKDVFSGLRKISVQTGSGSTNRKKSLIVNLMRCCREKEIKFLVRTLVRNLRIGAMMRTVLPALAEAVVMNSLTFNIDIKGKAENTKEKLQVLSTSVLEAYNMLPSLDLLVPSLIKEGIEFSSSTWSMIPGIPIKPMLAKVTNGVPQGLKLFQNKSFTCEYKYDGQRAQIHKLGDGSVRVFSRSGDETTTRFPDLIDIIRERCKPDAITFILDAEVVAINRKNGCKLMSFQELSSRERGSRDSTITVDKIKVDICIFAFDIMFANGEQLLGVPLRQRRKYLGDLFHGEKLGYFEYAKGITIEADDAYLSSETTVDKMNSFLNDAIQSSCEGIMVKLLDVNAGYSPSKRADTWLKVKQDYIGLNDTLDLVPIGAWHGNGRKAGWYSPFLMASYDPDNEEFQSVCRVMSGFSDSFYKEMKEFFCGDKILSKKPPYYQTAEAPDVWFAPELVWEIRGADLTISPVHQAAVGLVHPSRGISVRFPRFVRSVTDRKPEEGSTAADVAEMFNSQTRKMDVVR